MALSCVTLASCTPRADETRVKQAHPLPASAYYADPKLPKSAASDFA